MNRIMKLAGILLMGFILAYMGGCASAGGEEKGGLKEGRRRAGSFTQRASGRSCCLFFPDGKYADRGPKIAAPNGRHPLRNYAGNSLQQR